MVIMVRVLRSAGILLYAYLFISQNGISQGLQDSTLLLKIFRVGQHFAERSWSLEPTSPQLRSIATPTITEQSPGEVRVNPKDGQKYVWIPPGTFLMGCSPEDEQCEPQEKPPHQVMISRGFWMGETEVTVGAYKRFAQSIDLKMPQDPLGPEGKGFEAKLNDRWPIVGVAPIEAQGYCKLWAGGRLPTEAEWEYAARGMDKKARYGTLAEIAWYRDNSSVQKLHVVAQQQPNRFGLYDMLGSAAEWVTDWYAATYYQRSSSTDPQGPLESEADRLSTPGVNGRDGEMITLRGGGWIDDARKVRVSARFGVPQAFSTSAAGFRCIRELLIP